MPNKQLTQAGINRCIWAMLKQLGGKFVISEREVERTNTEDAIRIDHDPSIQTFTMSIHKVKNKKDSLIIQPGMN